MSRRGRGTPTDPGPTTHHYGYGKAKTLNGTTVTASYRADGYVHLQAGVRQNL